MNSDRQPSALGFQHQDSFDLPARIGARYEVLEQLGRGGMAIVYRVRDRSADCDVALKQLLLPGSTHDRQASELFEREFYVLAQLRHPSVIEVYDYGIDATGPYYTMELLDGGDLSTQAPLTCRVACQLMMQICSSLALLHSRRLLHRDVSPRNVRCTRAGTAKLIDFGAMVPMGPCVQSVGTPAFMAPEVLHHLNLDARTDLFSVGATLYYALTGRRAFAARTMAELNEVWRVEPTPPGRLVAGIPAALDELVMALLRIDPARRPRSAFEVMQRLATSAGVTHMDSDEISRAYLSTPTLVGRESEQRRFRQYVGRAAQAEGCALLFESAPGMGRSRLLDVCVLEAKTAGATVLRLDASSARHEPFASALYLAEQLLNAVPDSATQDVTDPALSARLFAATQSTDPSATPARTRLVAREQLQAEHYAAQLALLAWFRAASQRHLLVIAIDDIERIDDASLALIVGLVHGARGCQLLVVATLAQTPDDRAHPALAVLRANSVALALEPLTARQNEALFASIFFDAPHVALVSHRIHQIAGGRPREAMALARHLLDTRQVRYADGNWILPAEMAASDLPASAEDALRLRIAELPALARGMVEAQALALEESWARNDYLALMTSAPTSQVDEALATLLHHGVLVRNAGTYILSRLGAASCLNEQLSTTHRTERHMALAEMSARTNRHLLFEVHHRLQANEAESALHRLAPVMNDGSHAVSLSESSGLSHGTVADILERAQLAALSCQRRPREINELRRMLVESGTRTGRTVFDRHGPTWLAQLERDSGLIDYRAQSDTLAPRLRLQHALQAANARLHALPARERVYSPEEAITYLARYVTFGIVMAWRDGDTGAFAELADKLAPFAETYPLVHVLWQNGIVVGEVMHAARLEPARLRYIAMYEGLQGVSSRDMGYVEAIRLGAVQGIAAIEFVLGYPSVLEWIVMMEQSPNPIYRVNAQLFRRALCIIEGDAEAADNYRRQADVLSVQATGRPVFDMPIFVELYAQLHAGDLTGVKHVAERVARLAADAPGWLALHHATQGYFQQMRGDLPAAKHAFERALALSEPDRVDPPPMLRVWVTAVAGYITVLTELGEADEACRFGSQALARCEALGITHGHMHVRALALAEAKLGRHAQAAHRLECVIAQQTGMNSALLAADFEARALVAIWAQDRAGAAHFAQLALRQTRPDSTPLQLARRGRLLDEAARAGMALDLPASGFESTVLGVTQPVTALVLDARLAAALEGLRAPTSRASRALDLLCAATQATCAQLYWLQGDAFVRAAALGPPLEAALDGFVQGFFRYQVEQAAMSTIFTATEQASGGFGIGHWTGPSGNTYSVTLLKPMNRDDCCGAVAFVDPTPGVQLPSFTALVWTLSSRLIELASAVEATPVSA
jgi:hypothetical protein